MYPVKVYTIDGVLIYQVDNGDGNTGKTPKGGVIIQGSPVESMAISTGKPITYYVNPVINQSGHSKDLYDYYWTSYSRGTDGKTNNYPNNEPQWHNDYLDGYIPLRVKSIYDPCPYLYRIPSHGSWNQFAFNAGWTWYSYLGGISWDLSTLGKSWLPSLGWRYYGSSYFDNTGGYGFYYSSTTSSQTVGYTLGFSAGNGNYLNRTDWVRSYATSVRCIEGSLILFVSKKYAKTAEPVERRLKL